MNYPTVSTWTYTPPTLGISASATAVTVAAAPSDPTLSLCVDSIELDGATNTAMEFTIQDTAGVVLLRKAISTSGKSGDLSTFKQPLIATKGAGIQIKCSTGSFTGNIYCSLQGRTIMVGSGTYIPPPAPAVSPLRTHAYISPFGAEFSTFTVDATNRAFSLKFDEPPFPETTDWTRVRLRMPDTTGAPVVPEGIWFALANGGTNYSPTLDGGPCTFVEATGLTASAAGSDASPRSTPVCAYVDLPPTATARQIVVRVQYAGGETVTNFNMGTNAPDYPYGIAQPTYHSDISANPDTTGSWNFSFGYIPAMILEYDGLTTPVCCAAAIGDSHTRGYVFINGARGPWDYMKENQWIGGTYPNLSILNLGRAGHTTAEISTRLQAFEADLDIGLWLRQAESVNDKNGGFDFTVGAVSGFRTVLDSDAAFALAANKAFLPFQGPGQASLAAGAYGRYIGMYAGDFATVYPYAIRAVDGIITDVAGNGVYMASMSDDGGLHPGYVGQATWATAFSPILVANLTTLGYL